MSDARKAKGASIASAITAAALSLACGSAPVTDALEEPLRVEGGQFLEGALPGLPALTPEEISSGVEPVTPAVTDVSKDFQFVAAGDQGRVFRGHTSTDASSVAVRFLDAGEGYFVVPVQGPDIANEGQFTFSVSSDIALAAPPGVHPLAFAAIGAGDRSGTQQVIDLCVAPDVPDNLNACVPTLAPPALVVSLSWDSPVDLDLQVVTPSGKRVDSKHVTTAVAPPGMPPNPSEPGTGILDRDAYAACQPSGSNRENLVFQEQPPAGRYYVYADLFDACGESGVRFTVSLFASVPGAEPGTFRQVESFSQSGSLLAAQADAGSRPGLFVTEFVVQ